MAKMISQSDTKWVKEPGKAGYVIDTRTGKKLTGKVRIVKEGSTTNVDNVATYKNGRNVTLMPKADKPKPQRKSQSVSRTSVSAKPQGPKQDKPKSNLKSTGQVTGAKSIAARKAMERARASQGRKAGAAGRDASAAAAAWLGGKTGQPGAGSRSTKPTGNKPKGNYSRFGMGKGQELNRAASAMTSKENWGKTFAKVAGTAGVAGAAGRAAQIAAAGRSAGAGARAGLGSLARTPGKRITRIEGGGRVKTSPVGNPRMGPKTRSEARSEAAKKGWETRRSNKGGKKK